MTCPRLTLARGLAALALAAPASACVVTNPGFIFDTDGTGTDAGTTTATTRPTTGATDSSVGGTGTGVVDTGTTTESLTGEGPTATSGEPPDTSGEASSVGESDSTGSTGPDPGTTGGCIPEVMDLNPVEDAFFISGGTDNQTTCKYYDAVGDPGVPCKLLNFGATGALRIARMDGGIDAMYAARFPHAQLLQLAQKGVQIDHAELIMTVYDQVGESLTLQVGMIKANWMAGEKNGQLGQMGDSSFDAASIGFQTSPWPNGDGPRGASMKVADLKVPVGFGDHAQLVSGPFSLEPWLNDPLNVSGFVVSFPKGVAQGTYGPGLKAMESGAFQPILRVYTCMP